MLSQLRWFFEWRSGDVCVRRLWNVLELILFCNCKTTFPTKTPRLPSATCQSLDNQPEMGSLISPVHRRVPSEPVTGKRARIKIEAENRRSVRAARKVPASARHTAIARPRGTRDGARQR